MYECSIAFKILSFLQGGHQKVKRKEKTFTAPSETNNHLTGSALAEKMNFDGIFMS